jgi:formate dehydrogenase beta subunit
MPRRTEAGLPVLRMRPIPKGRAVDPAALAEVRALLGEAPRRRDLLIEHLHRIQDHFGHIADRHLLALARELGLSHAEVYEVATFYEHWDLVPDDQAPPGPITVRVCDSVTCEMEGSATLLAQLQDRVGDRARVIPVPCNGRCDRAPSVFVNRNGVGRATVAAVAAAVMEARTEPEIPEYRDLAAYRRSGGYDLLAQCVAGKRTPDSVAAELDASQLKGLGGAGFPAAQKWKFVRSEPAPRVLVVNADEGEPGTFKDRFIMVQDPHRLLEGALIAAWAVGAGAVYVYLRDEWPICRAIFDRALAELQADPPCELPEIHARRGAGAYICGEETALIESLEGKRGEPRLRPPFPAQRGVFGRPTLVHNVETLYWIPEILHRGGAWFAARGRPGHPGQRYFSVSGRVRDPGVYLAPNGITARELVERAGGMRDGHEFYAYLPGGASGGILPASLADLPLDFGGALAEYGCFVGSGAVIILSDHDTARGAALNVMRFFAHESCGKCTPCRAGTAKAVRLMHDGRWDVPLLTELGTAMADASICGLGQAAPNPVRCVIEHFSHELEP